MYIRIYPSRNTTIFKRVSGGTAEVLGNINTGKNPISEITDGNTQSAFLMNFDLTAIKDKLTAYPYTCNLKLWDAGVVFEPTITLKTVDLAFFESEFIEGDGFSYLGQKAINQATNWNERVTGTPWSQPSYFDSLVIATKQLNEANEDLLFEGIQSSIATAITDEVNPNFALRISTNEVSDQTFTKFLFTRHTRTVFKPFLEFFIEDNIVDQRQNVIATKSSNIYLLNNIGENFVGTVSVVVKDASGTTVYTPSILNPTAGVYYFVLSPTIDKANTILYDEWSIDSVVVVKNLIQVKSPNQITGQNLDNLFFYPTTSYLHQAIRKNDVVTFNITSEIRGKGSVVLEGYEFRVTSTNNFEIQPWTPVSLYDNKLSFTIDTSYYYAPLEYEVFVRLKEGKNVKTSMMSYKFKLVADEPTHMQSLAANPYSSRDVGFSSKS